MSLGDVNGLDLERESRVCRDVACALAKVLSNKAESTASVMPASSDLRIFFGVSAPPLDIFGYFCRLWDQFKCTPECYVAATVYIDRAVMRRPDLLTNDLSIHRLLLTGLVIAAKFQDDRHYTNAVYARIGGVSIADLDALERVFLSIVDWNLYVSRPEYERYYDLLENNCSTAKSSGKRARDVDMCCQDEGAPPPQVRRVYPDATVVCQSFSVAHPAVFVDMASSDARVHTLMSPSRVPLSLYRRRRVSRVHRHGQLLTESKLRWMRR
eukprot:TRINITY_DN51000_c0_g1_i1.p1 TRINITY_DN51000_c0_g1~~TRINITY_DN51000_c0_g1_i1.p1  ORF type:complete len:269 (-),score=23.63 TRINITY_DN51000_c0_g1_i1:317-1123(-)